MIIGVHSLIYAPEVERTRAFFRDVLGLSSVDAGGGWLIFALPPAELGIHPTEAGGGSSHELMLMCDDLDATMVELSAKGAEFVGDVTEARFGRVVAMRVPGGGEVKVYQPAHPTALPSA